MAGQHRPVAEPVPVAAAPVPAPEDSSSMFPSWSIWILLVVLAQVVRMCTSVSAPGTEFHVDQSQIDQRYRDNSPPLIVQHPAQDVLATDNEVARRLSLCDTKTRQKLIMYLRISQANRRSAESTVTDPSTGPQKPGLVLDESDPIVAALLENCQGSRYFDSNGMLKELPPPELPRNELPASQ
jgi:hypothetical protein